MKKTFSIISTNKTPARQVDAIKHEIKKYIARERRRDLPEGFDFWDFDCLLGATDETAGPVHLTKINAMIDQLIADGREDFFISLSAVARKRQKKKE